MLLSKGLGITALLAGGVVQDALYVGDDTTDIDAFRGLRELVSSGGLEPDHLRCGQLRRSARGADAGGRSEG